MCLFKEFPQWPWAVVLSVRILPAPHHSPHTHTYSYMHTHGHAHTCIHTPLSLPPSLPSSSFFSTLPPSSHLTPNSVHGSKMSHKFSERPFRSCLHPSVLLLVSPIPAREIQAQDTYSEHKSYFNLMAPAIASTWAVSPCNS